MAEYILDVSKWRCGGESGLGKLGEGDTRLLNSYGYMCCLGQFAKQSGVEDKWLRGVGTPDVIQKHMSMESKCELYDATFVSKSPLDRIDRFECTKLAGDLMNINDDAYSSHREKIDEIRTLLEKHGHSLKVINHI